MPQYTPTSSRAIVPAWIDSYDAPAGSGVLVDLVFDYGAHGPGALTVDEAVRLASALFATEGDTELN